MDLVGRKGRVDKEVPVRIGLGQRHEVGPDRLVEVLALGLEPVVDVPAAGP